MAFGLVAGWVYSDLRAVVRAALVDWTRCPSRSEGASSGICLGGIGASHQKKKAARKRPFVYSLSFQAAAGLRGKGVTLAVSSSSFRPPAFSSEVKRPLR